MWMLLRAAAAVSYAGRAAGEAHAALLVPRGTPAALSICHTL
jgi:hypothetical protein